MPSSDFKLVDAYRCGCPGCGQAMRYDIRMRRMLCDSCGESRAVTSLSDADADLKAEETIEVITYTCPACGATLNTNQNAATSYCSYCGSNVVLSARLNRMRRPDEITPFRITREECESIYRDHLRSAKYLPNAVLHQKTLDLFRPVYIPYWRYTYVAEGETKGSGTKRYSDSSYNYVDSYKFDIEGKITVTGAFYDASSSFDDETAQLLGVKYSKMDVVPFHPAYLCGIYTETPDVSDVVYNREIEAYAEQAFASSVSLRTSTDGHCRMPQDRRIEAKLALMPVWLLAERQGERVLFTAINGLDGTIVCDPPVSGKRFSLLTAALFCFIFAALMLISGIVILRPNILLGLCGLLAAIGMKQVVDQMDLILIKRAKDLDPTRTMKRRNPDRDRAIESPDLLANIKQGGVNKPLLLKILLICIILLFCVVLPITARIGVSKMTSLLISDHGILAPALLGVATFMLFRKNYTYREVEADEGRKVSGPVDILLLNAMRAAVIAGIVLSILPIPGHPLWCYGLSIAITLVFSVILIRLNCAHNEYVTRPVPIFGKGADQQ